MLDLTMVCFRRPTLYLNVKSDLEEGGNTPDAEEGQGWNTQFTKIGTAVNYITAFLRQIETFFMSVLSTLVCFKVSDRCQNQIGSL